MRITYFNTFAVALLAPVLFAPLYAADADAATDRMAQLEARLIAMEARLAQRQVATAPSSVSEARIAELKHAADADKKLKK